MRLRGNGKNGVTWLPGLFSQIGSRAPALRLQLSSTPRFFTHRDQVPGSSSLPSFVSDAAVFPGPLLLKDCGLDPLRPSAGGSHQQWPNVGCTQGRPWTLLLLVPETAPRCQPGPEKLRELVQQQRFRDDGKSQHIWHLGPPPTTLFQHQRMWLFSRVCRDQVASTVTTECPSGSGTAFPRVARGPPGLHSAPGDSPFPPEHHQDDGTHGGQIHRPLGDNGSQPQEANASYWGCWTRLWEHREEEGVS
ncbi:uncharacterized protein LOC123382742 [Felis catus]|uniref:uncharacterized protein LOC123382742 n=1 Tax=Felis catus TaxID=9685 RepID=UPI001D19F162|nr:uncharacterized protein LOC123382742 [Felis catus]